MATDKKSYKDMTPEERFIERITWNDDDIIITKRVVETPVDMPDDDDDDAPSYTSPPRKARS